MGCPIGSRGWGTGFSTSAHRCVVILYTRWMIKFAVSNIRPLQKMKHIFHQPVTVSASRLNAKIGGKKKELCVIDFVSHDMQLYWLIQVELPLHTKNARVPLKQIDNVCSNSNACGMSFFPVRPR